MMKTYARMVEGRAAEIFMPLVAEEDVFVPGALREDGSAGEPVLRYAAGQEIPIEDRFHPDFAAQLVEYDPDNPPEAPKVPEPPVIIAPTVTARQARLALLAAGKLADVVAAIDALPQGQREAAQIEWEYASVVERESPLVLMLGAALALDLDALFLQASTL